MVLALVVLFLGSGVVGVTLAEFFAPESWLASVAGLFALPLAFGLSMQWWFGLALIGAVVRLVRNGPRPQSETRSEPLPGSFVFLPVSSAMGLAAGIVVGILSPTYSAGVVILVYWTLGTLHGFAGWRLARAGILMPPESI